MIDLSLDDVQKVALACGCDEARARTLLMMHGNSTEEAIGAGKLTAPRLASPELLPTTQQPITPPLSSSGSSSLSGELLLPRKPVANASTGSAVGSSQHATPSIPGEYPPDIQNVSMNGIETPQASPYFANSNIPTVSFHSPDGVKSSGDANHEGDTHETAIESPTGIITPLEQDSIPFNSTNKEEVPQELGSKLEEVPKVPEIPEVLVPEQVEKPTGDEPVVSQWDFRLPRVALPKSFVAGGKLGTDELSMRDVIGAIQNGTEYRKIVDYLNFFDERRVSKQMKMELLGFPTIFYAVERNEEQILRLWISYGADVNAIHKPTGVPLIAFAIFNVDNIFSHTTTTVATLLACGASPKVIPKAFYTPYSDDLPDNGPPIKAMGKLLRSAKRQWSAPEYIREKLARTFNLSQRFYMHRAATTKSPTLRQKQVAKLRNAEPVLGLEYFLIGQTGAVSFLKTRLLSYLTLPRTKPLVLVFAGPSGHGKTELAKQLGHLMSLNTQIVDCTHISQETDLFGQKIGVVGAQIGTPLNNFITENDGERGIVFLDEFEKTTQEVHHALLIPFDNGSYLDRRSNKAIDCSKLIWILATNALDPTIKDFCNAKKIIEATTHDQLLLALKELSQELKKELKPKFGAPLTGRISSIIPFVPFSLGEQAVVAHKFALEMADKVRAPVCLKQGDNGANERLFGNVYLRLRRDATVCKLLASRGYDQDLGARSLMNIAEHEIQDPLVEEYLNVREEIKEGQAMKEFVVSVVRGEFTIKAMEEDDDSEVEIDSEDDGEAEDEETAEPLLNYDSDDEE